MEHVGNVAQRQSSQAVLVAALLVCLSILKAGAASDSAQDAGAALLQACYNSKYNSTPTTFDDFLKGRPSRCAHAECVAAGHSCQRIGAALSDSRVGITDLEVPPPHAACSLYVHKVFWSAKRSSLPLTVFAGATVSRLDALEAQCRSWRGPHAAAVYLPLLQQASGKQLAPDNQALLDEAASDLRKLFERWG